MIKKIAPLSGQGEKGRSAKQQHRDNRVISPCQGYVSLYPGKGVKLSAPNLNATAGPGGKRKSVVGWSSSSRRRMRMVLLTSTGPAGWVLHNTTLTVPGPVLSLSENIRLWKSFCREVESHEWCAIWRVEIQKRGALHWHMILWAPVWSPVIARRRVTPDTDMLPTPEVIRHEWSKALATLGPVQCDTYWMDPFGDWHPPALLGNRFMLPGADQHAVNVQTDVDAKGAWLRYLQDHATKAKQEQIPESIGRHWGIIGRKYIQTVSPGEIDALTREQYFRFLRWYQRLCRPSFKSSHVPFGRKLGYRPSRGSRGTSVWFSNTDTVRRLVSRAIFCDLTPTAESRKTPLPLPS